MIDWSRYDGENIKLVDGKWRIWVAYADHEPIFIDGDISIAKQVEAAIDSAFRHGLYMGQSDL